MLWLGKNTDRRHGGPRYLLSQRQPRILWAPPSAVRKGCSFPGASIFWGAAAARGFTGKLECAGGSVGAVAVARSCFPMSAASSLRMSENAEHWRWSSMVEFAGVSREPGIAGVWVATRYALFSVPRRFSIGNSSLPDFACAGADEAYNTARPFAPTPTPGRGFAMLR